MTEGKQESYFRKKDTRQIFDAKVQIKNALNVVATLKIYGSGMMSLQSMGLRKLESTKSLTFVYLKNSTQSTTKEFAQNSIGKRRQGDELLHFESRLVRNNNRFPSRVFEYSGGEYITFIGFSFNVSRFPSLLILRNY